MSQHKPHKLEPNMTICLTPAGYSGRNTFSAISKMVRISDAEGNPLPVDRKYWRRLVRAHYANKRMPHGVLV
jgi:hypothetical protein